jgi:MFS family permease
VASITGPSVGGILYAVAESWAPGRGAVWVYGAASILLLAAAVMIALIAKRKTPLPRSQISWERLLEGLRFIWRRKTVLGAISLDLFAVLFGGATALLPAYTRDVLHAGPEVFGYLRAAPGVGAGVTALWLAFRPISHRVGVTMFTGVGAFGIATMVLGLTHWFWLAMIALVVLGIGDMCRVFIGASNELGEFESGLTASWWGLVPAIIAGGALTLAVSVLWARVLFPKLWRMQTFDQLKDGLSNAP